MILLQPRRVAAQGAAARIAAENGWNLGAEVGYQVRFDRRIGPKTLIRVETEGILNRQIVADPFLEGVGGVLLDEFHERSIHTDLALALLREIQESVREDLLLVVMSATLDAAPVARYLGGCPVVTVPGRTHPVTITYRPEPHPAASETIAEAVAGSLAAYPDDRGDLLVFLPGAEEIRRSAARLADRHDLAVLPLHGSLPAEEQERALRPDPQGRRKLILATNIAETSLTIEGIGTVIDSGLARRAGYDAARGLDRLELRRISQASADQRAGRAGRLGPGRCVRLWSTRQHAGLEPSETPEIARIDLCGTILTLHAWGLADPSRFGWLEPPDPARVDAAERLLLMLGALDDEPRRINPLGRRLLEWPVHPRLGRLMIAAAEDGFFEVGAALAVLLSEKDIIISAHGSGPGGRRGSSDLLARLDLLAEAGRAPIRSGPASRRDRPGRCTTGGAGS